MASRKELNATCRAASDLPKKQHSSRYVGWSGDRFEAEQATLEVVWSSASLSGMASDKDYATHDG